MEPSAPAYYAAFAAKDARFDGRFFVGIASTGIYCRPVCRARLPKPANCTFFSSAAGAEQAGFRPCLLCRPELAPGLANPDGYATLARRTADLIEEHCSAGLDLATIADRLGYTARHVRRVFAAELGVTPVQYLQTSRLLLAKRLLTDTDLAVVDVALASGFGSLRRFNGAFKQHYRLSPTGFRKQLKTAPGQVNPGITVAMGYRPPYQWDAALTFLAGRAITGVEAVDEGGYARTVRIVADDGQVITGWLRVSPQPQKPAVLVTLSPTLLPVISQVLARVRRLFDLDCEPNIIAETLEPMNAIRPGSFVPGLRVPSCFDSFEMACRAVLGQQVTVRTASLLAGRIVQRFGTPIDTGIAGLSHSFPTTTQVLALADDIEEHFGVLGVVSARSRTIVRLADAIERGELDLTNAANPPDQIEKLLAIKGIGPWTANYIAMRALAWPDAFLETDSAIKKALAPRTPKQIRQLAEDWRPWRSYATFGIWNSL